MESWKHACVRARASSDAESTGAALAGLAGQVDRERSLEVSTTREEKFTAFALRCRLVGACSVLRAGTCGRRMVWLWLNVAWRISLVTGSYDTSALCLLLLAALEGEAGTRSYLFRGTNRVERRLRFLLRVPCPVMQIANRWEALRAGICFWQERPVC